jgi:hypothetical protein
MATEYDPRARVGDKDVRGYYNPSTSVTIPKERFVTVATSGSEHIQLPADTATPLTGVTMEDILPESRGDVQISGTARVAAAGALVLASVGQVNGDTDGKAQAATGGSGANYAIGGQLRTPAGVEDDVVEVELLGLGTLQQGE